MRVVDTGVAQKLRSAQGSLMSSRFHRSHKDGTCNGSATAS
jgi:hypothetical protein